MLAVSVLAGLVALATVFVAVFAWAYFVVFRHDFILYADRLSIANNHINIYIHNNVNEKYGLAVQEVAVDDEDTYERPSAETGPEQSRLARKVVGVLFSLVTALSIELIVLMMCELTETLAQQARLVAFQITIDSLIVLITVVVPLLIVSLCTNDNVVPTQSTGQKSVAVVLYGLWFVALHYCGHLSKSFVPDRALHTRLLLERKINEVVIGGISTMAVLSGIGCVSTPYKMFWTGWVLKSDEKAVTEADLTAAVASYNNTKNLLERRKDDLRRLTVSDFYNHQNRSLDVVLRLARLDPGPLGRKIIHKVLSFASLSSLVERLEEEELQAEIDSLLTLSGQLYRDLTTTLHQFCERKERLRSNRKALSRMIWIANVLFAAYCVYRVVNVVFLRLPDRLLRTPEAHRVEEADLASDGTEPAVRDALAVSLARIINSVFSLPYSDTQLTNQISFVLLAGLFVCSFSNVVLTFRSVGQFLPQFASISDTAKRWLKHLLVAELLAIYVILTALLIRTNLPTNLSNQISRILLLLGSSATFVTKASLKEVEFIDLWFDKVFGFTCIATLIFMAAKGFAERPDTYDAYDEEMFMESRHKVS